MHTSEKESFSSDIYTAGIISIVLRVCCMFAVIYHIQQYTVAQDFLWQGARVNCDRSGTFAVHTQESQDVNLEYYWLKLFFVSLYSLYFF